MAAQQTPQRILSAIKSAQRWAGHHSVQNSRHSGTQHCTQVQSARQQHSARALRTPDKVCTNLRTSTYARVSTGSRPGTARRINLRHTSTCAVRGLAPRPYRALAVLGDPGQAYKNTVDVHPQIRWCSGTVERENKVKRKVYDESGIEITTGKELIIPCTWDGCKRKFSTEHNLAIHMCTHTGDQPYPCLWDQCTEVFSREDLFKHHLKWHCREYVRECAEQQRAEERQRARELELAGKTTTQDKGQDL